MEIFIRLLVWILNLVYGPRGDSAVTAMTENPMDEIVLRQYEEERKSKRLDSIVESFKSTAATQGTVDYDDLKWDSYDTVVETAEQFVFYNRGAMQKIIAKSAFRNHREIVTLRRVIHRHVRNNELRDDGDLQ